MKSWNRHLCTASTLATVLLGACAAVVPQELASARVAYKRASTGPAARSQPAEVHKAHEALREAEEAFADEPESYHTLDLAYVAERKAETAEALAEISWQEEAVALSNNDYSATQTQVVKQTKQALTQTRSDLAESERDTQKAADRLAVEKQALAASEQRGAATGAQLVTEQKARVAADKRASDAMLALANLAAVKEEARGLVITLSGSVLFGSNEAILLPSAQTRLGQVADALMAEEDRALRIEGHSDSRGKAGHNIELSQRRAEAVRSFLVSKGYDANRVTAHGVGPGQPVADNATAEGRANNRRVEIVVSPKSPK